MSTLKCAVVTRAYRFRLHRPDGAPTDIIAAVRAESEDAARLRLPQNSDESRDWRLESAEED